MFMELLDSLLGFVVSIIILTILFGTIAILFFVYTDSMINLTVFLLVMISIHVYSKSGKKGR